MFVCSVEHRHHRLINRQASQTRRTSRNSFGCTGVRRRTHQFSRAHRFEEWLEEGGEREDDWFRFLRHFHDPLKPWDGAGLDLGIDRHDSSVRWMQEPNQATWIRVASGHGAMLGGCITRRSSSRMRRYREVLWADLFRALGQIMHLVVDASVPEHTRNDAAPAWRPDVRRARMSTGCPASMRRRAGRRICREVSVCPDRFWPRHPAAACSVR